MAYGHSSNNGHGKFFHVVWGKPPDIWGGRDCSGGYLPGGDNGGDHQNSSARMARTPHRQLSVS